MINKTSITSIASEMFFIAQVVKERGESTFFSDFLVLLAASDAYGRWLEQKTGKTDTIDSVLARALRAVKLSSDAATVRINSKFVPQLTPGLLAMFNTASNKPWTYSGIMFRSNVIRTIFRRMPSAKLKPMFDIPREYTMVNKAMEASDLDDEVAGFKAIAELPVRTPIFKTIIRRLVSRVSGESAYVPVEQAIEAASMETNKLTELNKKKDITPIGSPDSKKNDDAIIAQHKKINEATKDVEGGDNPVTKSEVIAITSLVVNSGKKPKAFEDVERITGYPLDEEQESAILTEGRVLVAASAGAGKTGTLSAKVAYMIKDKNIDPSKIFVTTFTKNAADEMRERIRKLIGDKADDCFIGTYHSFSLKMLTLYGSPIYKEAIKNSQARGFNYSGLIKIALSEFENNTGKKPTLSPKEVQLLIANFKSNQIEPDKVDEFIKTMQSKEISDDEQNTTAEYQDAGEIYKIFETLKGRHKIFGKAPYYDSGSDKWGKTLDKVEVKYKRPLIDFDDMQNDFCTYLEKAPSMKERVQGQFKNFIIDEAQDCNDVQLKLFKLMTEKVDGSKGDSAWVVGDANQSIYQFRGAKPKNFLALANDPNWTTKKIRTNYRCKPEIVNAANNLIAHNKDRIEMEALPSRTGNAQINFNRGYPEDLANAACDKIKQQISIPEVGEKSSAFAILARTNAELHDFEAGCIVRGIPYKRKGGSNFFNRKEIKKVMAWVTLATSDDAKLQNEAILEAYDYPGWFLSSKFIEELKMNKSGKSYMELINNSSFAYGLGREARGIEDFNAAVQSLKRWIAAEKDNPEKKITTHQLVDEIMSITGAKGESIADFVKNDVKDEAVEDGDEKQKESYGAVEFLLKMAEPDPTEPTVNPSDPYQFLNKVESMKVRAKELKSEESGVTLSTIHAAKGLQWKNVIASMIPPRQNSDIEEERRMAYVQITRAADNLDVLSPSVKGNKKLGVSQFITEAGLEVLDNPQNVASTEYFA